MLSENWKKSYGHILRPEEDEKPDELSSVLEMMLKKEILASPIIVRLEIVNEFSTSPTRMLIEQF